MTVKLERLVHRNADKPHRCPECHRVVAPMTRWWRTYNCRNCMVWWWGWR